MGKKDPRVDAYIAKSAELARDLLTHLRQLVHQACPDVVETIKWGAPAFEHKGLLCGMAAFKQHAGFYLWKRELVLGKTAQGEARGQFGQLRSLADLPADRVLLGYLKKVAALNEAGIRSPSRARAGEKPELTVPDFLTAALKKNRKAQATFEKFSYSHKKEYVEWLTEAKRDETREKRLRTALEWLATGKPRNWKYASCSG